MIEGHSYGCLMAVVPRDVALQITSWAASSIHPTLLGVGGIEKDPHITIKYGFEDDGPGTVASIRDLLKNQGLIDVALGDFGTFPDGGDGEVLFVAVESPRLRELNRIVTRDFPCKDSHPTYRPHLTVAYLKPGVAARFAALQGLPFLRRTARVTEVTFSDRQGNVITIPLGTSWRSDKALSWLASGSGGALVPTPAWRAIGGKLRRPRVTVKGMRAAPEEDELGNPDQRLSLIVDIVGGLMDLPSLQKLATKYYGGGQKSWGDFEVKEIVEKKDKRGRRYCTEKGRGWIRVKCPGAPQVKPSRIRKQGQGDGGGGSGKPSGGGGRRPVAEEDKPAKKGDRPQVGAVYDEIKKIQAAGAITPDQFDGLMTTLMKMTVKDLTELKKQLGLKASGDKRAYAHKIATRAFGGVNQGEPEPKPKPKPKPAVSVPRSRDPFLPGRPISERIAAYEYGAKIVGHLAAFRDERVRLQEEYREARRSQAAAYENYTNVLSEIAMASVSGKMSPEQKKNNKTKKEAARKALSAATDHLEIVGAKQTGIDQRPREAVQKLLKAEKPADFQVVPSHDLPSQQAERMEEALSWLKPILESNDVTPWVSHEYLGDPREDLMGNSLRAHYTPTHGDMNRRPVVSTNAISDQATHVHEYGHYVEDTFPGVSERAKEFLKYRVGDEAVVKFNEVITGRRYRDDERGRKDNFDKHFRDAGYYVGKEYSSGDTEIVSMGLEALYKDPSGFAKNDPEYCTFIVGILTGHLR